MLLIVVFNYVVGCMCMLCFKSNDPFHFGTISRSMVRNICRVLKIDVVKLIVRL